MDAPARADPIITLLRDVDERLDGLRVCANGETWSVSVMHPDAFGALSVVHRRARRWPPRGGVRAPSA